MTAVKRTLVSSFIQTLVRTMCFSFLGPALLSEGEEAQEKNVLRFLGYSGVLSDACIVRMVIMHDVHLRNLDLNLIHPLYALLEECHVTRAAKRSFLSQSAMSRALERLRDMFGDPLLVRNGRGYERTVRGERLLRELESLIPRLEDMVRGEKFDPARSQEVFRVAMSDHASMIVLPSLLASVRKAAPHIKLEVSASGAETYEDVAAGRINTFLCAEEAPPFPGVRNALYLRFCLSRWLGSAGSCSSSYAETISGISARPGRDKGGATGFSGSRSVAAWRKAACRVHSAVLCACDLCHRTD